MGFAQSLEPASQPDHDAAAAIGYAGCNTSFTVHSVGPQNLSGG
jgi:hypothetical protein